MEAGDHDQRSEAGEAGGQETNPPDGEGRLLGIEVGAAGGDVAGGAENEAGGEPLKREGEADNEAIDGSPGRPRQ
jgi:hypothetical protein